MTYTLIDIPSGTVIHVETYLSAMRLRMQTGTGIIVRDDSPVYMRLIAAARKEMDQSTDN